MNKQLPVLSPASFVMVHTPHTKAKHKPANSILTELLIQSEPTGVYSTQVRALRERFNDMYYRFLEKLTVASIEGNLSYSQHKNLHSLFDELLEMRIILEKEPISTT